jgi:hypothetical protein
MTVSADGHRIGLFTFVSTPARAASIGAEPVVVGLESVGAPGVHATDGRVIVKTQSRIEIDRAHRCRNDADAAQNPERLAWCRQRSTEQLHLSTDGK